MTGLFQQLGIMSVNPGRCFRAIGRTLEIQASFKLSCPLWIIYRFFLVRSGESKEAFDKSVTSHNNHLTLLWRATRFPIALLLVDHHVSFFRNLERMFPVSPLFFVCHPQKFPQSWAHRVATWFPWREEPCRDEEARIQRKIQPPLERHKKMDSLVDVQWEELGSNQWWAPY